MESMESTWRRNPGDSKWPPTDIFRMTNLKDPKRRLFSDIDVELVLPSKRCKPSVYADLYEKGVQVMQNPVLTPNELKAAHEGCDAWIASCERSPLPGQRWFKNTRGIIEYPTAAQAPFVWQIRANPNVVQPFVAFWSEATKRPQLQAAHMLVSMDRINLQPPSIRKPRQNINLHMDQGTKLRGLQCVQGFVSLVDVEKEGTLVVLEGSHLLHDAFFQHFPARDQPTIMVKAKSSDDEEKKVERKRDDNNWVALTEEEQAWYSTELKKLGYSGEPKRILCQAGQLVLWDSRTIHSASNATEATPNWRKVVYVCYLPRPKDWVGSKDQKRKLHAFTEHRGTSHWPCKRIKMFPKRGNYCNETQQPAPRAPLCVESATELRRLCGDLALSLVGF